MKLLQDSTQRNLDTIKTSFSSKGKVVFVSGDFNVLHSGHLRFLRSASEYADYLIVGVLNDELGSQTFISENDRCECVRSISFVDFAFVLDDPVDTFIEFLKPDIVVKGKEHESKFNSEKEIVESYGGKLLFSSGESTETDYELLRNQFKPQNTSTVVKPIDFPKNHGFTIDTLEQVLQKIQNLNVVVIGESIVDEYLICDPLGMSQEDPTVVVTPRKSDKFLGAAGIVSAHVAGLGANSSFFSVLGEDETAGFVLEKLKQYNVNAHTYTDISRPTILKKRYRAKEKTLLRVNYLHQHTIYKEIQDQIFQDFTQVAKGADLVIFSDFNYGLLPNEFLNRLSSFCLEHEVMMVADSQSSSQVGDVSRFHHMNLLTPTEREARLALRDFDSGLVVLADKLQEKAHSKNILMTLGAEGVLVHARHHQDQKEWITDRLPSMNMAPKDVSGAGDSLMVLSAMALAVGADIWQSAYLGSLAAGLQISRTGNFPLSTDLLLQELKR